MYPDNPQVPTGSPTNYTGQPDIQHASLPQSAIPSHSTPQNSNSSAETLIRARQLVAQHAGDPYRICESFGQLKAAYLADQYHITVNQVEE